MFAVNLSGSGRTARSFMKIFGASLCLALAALPQTNAAQELALAGNLPANMLARVAPKPEPALPLLERLETLETLTASEAPAEIHALFAEGLPCQLHARSEAGVEITEVHPLFPASVAPTEPAPANAPLPKMTPTPKPVALPLMSASADDAPYVNEKINSLQKMVSLMQAKEELLKRRAFYERKLGEFDGKVGKE
jgi:hypothetical protein